MQNNKINIIEKIYYRNNKKLVITELVVEPWTGSGSVAWKIDDWRL